MKIFGHEWEDIQRAQQGGKLHKPTLPYCAAAHSAKVQSDVDRFKIDVHRDVKDALSITLPDDYKLVGEVWTAKGGDQ